MSTAWDGEAYDRLSDPQLAMARPVLDRLRLSGDETVLDVGCGTGRVTELLVERLPRGRVIAIDASPSMVEQARGRLGDRAQVRLGDALDLRLEEPVDAILSTAVFHWIADHDRLFAGLHAALRPGGQLVVQCGGEGNIARVRSALGDRAHPWHFAGPRATERRLRAAGFREARCWLQELPVQPADPESYVRQIVLHGHPDAGALAPRVLDALGDPPTVDYVRLNVEATA